MLGIPEQPIREVFFDDVHLTQYAWEGPIPAPGDFPDLRGVYPDAHMIDGIGPSPACGLWARDVRDLTVRDFRIETEGKETRPLFLLP